MGWYGEGVLPKGQTKNGPDYKAKQKRGGGAWRAFLSVMTAGLMAGVHLTRSAVAKGNERYADLDTLALALHHIEAQHLAETNTRSLVYGAISGMTDSLDLHSTFLDPDAVREAEVRTEGWFSGVGIEINRSMGHVVITRTVPGGPADVAGVLRGDRLTAVDDHSAQGESLSTVSTWLQGEADTTVSLGLLRADKSMTITLSRARIRDKTVRVDLIKDGWVLAEMVRFQRNTAADLDSGLQTIAESTRLKGMILDLRNNPGGLLDEAVSVVDLFSNKGLVVETRGRSDMVLEHHDASGNSPFAHLDIIILIDEQSASAAEIVAGALQAHGRAKLVGQPSYGKWSVQRMYRFEDGSALKLTVARYHLAAETRINAGLTPDLVVDMPTVHAKNTQTLRQLIEPLEPASRTKALELIETLTQDGSELVPIYGTISERLTHDPQLAAAWKIAQNGS